MIAIIDYKLGNVKAIAEVYKRLGMAAAIISQPHDLNSASKVILPGVGSFDHAIQKLNQSGMRPILDEIIFVHQLPVLGICVGMQMLSKSSEEGVLPGLGWIDGEVKKFDHSSLKCSMRLPHMGWNNVRCTRLNRLFNGLENDAHFYFLHSYYFKANKSEDVIAISDFGGEFSCAVNLGNIFGVQFHPEKSHHWGIRLLENFAKI